MKHAECVAVVIKGDMSPTFLFCAFFDTMAAMMFWNLQQSVLV
jgi:hypothetical protein